MITRHGEEGYRPMVEGIVARNLAHGERTMLMRFRLAAGSRLPPHSHPHEQTGFLLSGSLRFTIDGETTVMTPGDSWCIPGGVEHAAEALADSEALELFSPPREAYLG